MVKVLSIYPAVFFYARVGGLPGGIADNANGEQHSATEEADRHLQPHSQTSRKGACSSRPCCCVGGPNLLRCRQQQLHGCSQQRNTALLSLPAQLSSLPFLYYDICFLTLILCSSPQLGVLVMSSVLILTTT